MAVARVICRCEVCGEEFVHTKKCYNRREADNYEEWAAEHITTCPDCYKKQLQEKRMAENAQAAKLAEKNGLPELVGSEKQVAWATSIRQKFFDEWDGKSEDWKDKNRANREIITKAVVKASEWIDNRDLDFVSTLYSIFQNHKEEWAQPQGENKAQ